MLLQRENDLQNKQKQTLLDIRSCLEDSKAFNIVEIDLSGKTEQADFMLIATGSSKVQISAISQKVISHLKGKKISVRVEGVQNCDWVLIDAGDVILNLFREEVRDFYLLEKLWG